ncbi:MAG: DNA polymerase III subunit delta' [Elusimicrobia bacterium]|nr:DNA polymerase III subunit delta' [Elusimicrobiota bacterium]
MSFKSIINQKKAKDIIAGQILSGKIPHAYLFLGPDGVGRKKMALELAKTLNCHHPNTPIALGTSPAAVLTEPCDHCLSCKKIDTATHPDVQTIDFEWQARRENKELEKQRSIKIETIRAVQHEISLKPTEGRWKVFIIDPAEKITLDAANCLLKTLEEPPRWTMLILLARHKENLPATIVSRTQSVPFGPLPEKDIVAWLILNGGLSNDDAHEIARLSEGSLTTALKLVADKTTVSEPLLSRVIRPDAATADLLRISQEYAKTSDAFLDKLLAEAKQQFRREPHRFAPMVAEILRTRQLISKNVSSLMALDALLLNLNQRGT